MVEIRETNPKINRKTLWTRDDNFLLDYGKVKLIRINDSWELDYNKDYTLTSGDLRAIANKLDKYNNDKRKRKVSTLETSESGVKNIWLKEDGDWVKIKLIKSTEIGKWVMKLKRSNVLTSSELRAIANKLDNYNKNG